LCATVITRFIREDPDEIIRTEDIGKISAIPSSSYKNILGWVSYRS